MHSDLAVSLAEIPHAVAGSAVLPTPVDLNAQRIIDDAATARVISTLPEIMWVARPDGFVLFVNDTGLKYLGVEFDKVGGWAWLQFVHPADRERVMHAWIEATMERRSMEISYRMLFATGRYHQNLVRAQPVCDETGVVTSYVGVHTDMENLMETRAALSSANVQIESLEALLSLYEEHCPVGLLCVDRDIQLVRVNARFCEMAGLRSIAEIGTPLEELLGRDGRVVARAAADVRSTGVPQIGMALIREDYAPQRRVRQWRLSFYPMPSTVEEIAVVVIASEQ